MPRCLNGQILYLWESYSRCPTRKSPCCFCCPFISREHGGVDFNTINLNSTACWFDDCPSIDVVNIHQLEKNTIFVATECIRQYNNNIMYNSILVLFPWLAWCVQLVLGLWIKQGNWSQTLCRLLVWSLTTKLNQWVSHSAKHINQGNLLHTLLQCFFRTRYSVFIVMGCKASLFPHSKSLLKLRITLKSSSC